VRHAHDLVALVAGATGNAATIAAMRGLRGARLRAIKADIAANLANCGLTVASIAAGRGVSSRYVHKLFEPTGSTFSQFVLEQRLSRAYRVLSERRFDDQPISAIAFAAGFGDLSHFNRTFRRRYGVRPSEVRSRGAVVAYCPDRSKR